MNLNMITKTTVTRILAFAALLASVGCADKDAGDDEVADTLDTDATQDADADADADAGTENADTTNTTSDGDSTDSADATADGDSTDDDDDDTNGTNGTKFDLGIVPDTGFMNCQNGGNNDADFSYLWAANSDQGTITKIDTATVTEVGRYIVRPDSNGSPSRTSVSLSGHVAVANRSGGVTKIYANPDLCQESNGTPGIQTSNNNQALPWGQEECIAWYHPFGYASQRPVAWGLGEFNQGTCQYEDEELWTSGNNQNGSLDIIVLDGDDGTIKEMIAVPTGGNNLASDFYGIYGGAVDGNGDFWGSQLGSEGKLLKVTRSDMSYEVIQPPQVGAHWYGMTVDSDGMVWLCSDTAARYDPMTESWAHASVGGSSGCMADASENGLLWMGSWGQVVGVNRDTLAVEKTCPVDAYGISIDFEGYVWGVAYGSAANKIDPETCQTWTYNGLVGAYTYSDMTGYALSNVGTPSG